MAVTRQSESLPDGEAAPEYVAGATALVAVPRALVGWRELLAGLLLNLEDHERRS